MFFIRSAYGNRTRVSAVRGPRPRPLDESAMPLLRSAEAGGFEPPVRLPVRQFSKLLVSATHPNFHTIRVVTGALFLNCECKGSFNFLYHQMFERFFEEKCCFLCRLNLFDM